MRQAAFCWSILLALLSGTALAQQETTPKDLQPIEDGAPILGEAGDAALEPEVTIRREGGTQFKEHRINGRLYKVQVIPDVGPPYYLMDMVGNGEWTRIDSTEHLIVPQWVILRF